MSLIAHIPEDLFCELAERWLGMKDIVHLDSAFCNHSARSVLLDLLNMSVAPPFTAHKMKNALDWFLKRSLILETVYFQPKNDLMQWNNYLRKFGEYVKSVTFRDSIPVAVVAKYCKNVQSFTFRSCDFSDAILGLLSLSEQLISIRIDGLITEEYNSKYLLASHHLLVKDLSISMDDEAEKSIFNMCSSECVERLKCYSVNNQKWTQFVNLRSLGFYSVSYLEWSDIVTVLQQCTSICHLDLSNVPATDEVVITAARHLVSIQTLNLERNKLISNIAVFELVKLHNQSLEAVYIHRCSKITADAINTILQECSQLHTLSVSHTAKIDYSLICNITTLITDFPSDTVVWDLLQQYCHSVKTLYLVVSQSTKCKQLVPLHMYDQAFPVLRTLYYYFRRVSTVGHTERVAAKAALLLLPPTLLVLKAVKWYDLFET